MSISDLKLTATCTDGNESLLCADVNNDKILVGGENGVVLILDKHSELSIASKLQTEKKTDITSVCFSKLSPYFLCASGCEILTFDIRNPSKPVKESCHNTDEINQIQLSSDEKFLLCADDTGAITVTDFPNDILLHELVGHKNACFTLQIRPNRSHELVSGGFDCELIHWNYQEKRKIKSLDMNKLNCEGSPSLTYVNPRNILSLVFSPDNSTLAVGLQDGSIQLWNARKARLRHQNSIMQAHTSLGVTQVRYLPATNRLISGGNDGIIKVWDENAAEPLQILMHDEKINWLTSSCPTAGVPFLVVCDISNKVSVYDLVI